MADITFPSWAGGEVSPSYYGRTDQDSYFVSAKTLHNYIASQTGPAIGRGGTAYIARTKGNGRALVIPFQFNEEQAYVAEFGDGYVRIYKDRGQVYEDAINITGISKANPAVVTAAHDLTDGRTIWIEGVGGMVEVADGFYKVEHMLGSAVNISDIDRSSPVKLTLSGGHGFVGGEDVYFENVGGMTELNDRTLRLTSIGVQQLSITDITQANPAVVTVSGTHGMDDGAIVVIDGVEGMTEVNGTRFTISPKASSAVNISAITQANPGVVTTTADHGFEFGSKVRIESVSGMTEVNDTDFTIGRSLQANKNIQSMTGSSSGGLAGRVRLQVNSHGYTTGDWVYISEIGFATQLLGKQFTITRIDGDTIQLDGTDITTVSHGFGVNFGFPPYIESGKVNRVDKDKFSLTSIDTTGYSNYTSGGTATEYIRDQFELDGTDSTGFGAYTASGSVTEVSSDEFYLIGENGLKYGAYTSGGTVKAVDRTQFKLHDADDNAIDSTGFSTFTSGGTIEAIHEIASPYVDADLFDADGLPKIQYAQSNDFLFLAHPSHPPRQLTRSGHSDWALSEFINEEGPFLEENLSDTTIYVDAPVGTGRGAVVTLHSSVPLWSASHVGAMWQLRLKDDATAILWTTSTAYTLGQEIINGDLFYRCTDAGTSGTEAPTHDIGEAYDGADAATNCKWLYIHNGRGIVIITGYTSPTEVTATVVSELPTGVVDVSNATGRWNEGAWSDVQGYPRSVALHEGRLVWGGTLQEPLAMDFSSTESPFYYNPIEPDGTVTRATAFRRVLDSNNPIRWMKSTEKGLVVGTLSGEWIVATEGVSQGFGPDTAVARAFSENGASPIQPIRNGDSLVYVHRARKRLRDITFSIDQQKLVTSDRNLRADHIATDGITAIAYAEEPHRVIWCLLGNGEVVGLTYNREPAAQVSAWHGHVIAGAFGSGNAVVESITVIPSPNAGVDDLYLVVKRTVNGETVRYVEYMEQPLNLGEAIEDGIYMDSAISYDGSPVTNISGADHLEGETVDVLADGVYLQKEISGGAFSEALDEAASKIHVGLYSTRVLETVFIESRPGDQVNTKKQTKRVSEVQVEVVESTKGWIGTDADSMDQMVFDEFYDQDGAPRRVTGPIEETVNDDYGQRKSVRFEQREPYPTYITSLTAQFEVSND